MKILSRLKTVAFDRDDIDEDFSRYHGFMDGIYFNLYFNSKKHPELLKFSEDFYGEGEPFLSKPEKGCDCVMTDVYLKHYFEHNEEYFNFDGSREFNFYADDSAKKDSEFTKILSKKDLEEIEDVLNSKVDEISYDEFDPPYILMRKDAEVFLD